MNSSLFFNKKLVVQFRNYLLMAFLCTAPFWVHSQNPYANFDNPLFIPDTLSSWPPTTHSTIHLDVMEDSLVLFPNASASNPVMPGFAFRAADTLPIKTLTYSNPATNNPGILGPTLIWWHGDSVTMEVENHLNKATTTHWHGAHVAGGNDGGPHQGIQPNKTWSPSFKIRDDVSTMWYHPHLHHHTMEQVQRGMAGLIIVKNLADTTFAKLPHDYGVNDFPIIFQDKFVAYDSTTQRDTLNYCCSLGTIPLVNGTWKPTLNIPDTGMVRFRILNGSSERTIILSLQVGDDPNHLLPFQVIASDAGYLEEPYLMNTRPITTGSLDSLLIIMASERYEIVFDASGLNGQPLFLVNRRDWMQHNEWIETFAGGPSYDNPSCYAGPYPDATDLTNMNNDPCADTLAGWMVRSANFDSLPMPMLKIVPTANPNSPIVGPVPPSLAKWEIPTPAEADVIRTKNLLGYNVNPKAPPFSIDGINFDMKFINDYPKLNATEIWDVYNSSGVAHPFHVHDIHFFITQMQVIDSAGDATTISIPPYLRGPKDVMPVASSINNHPFNTTIYPQMKYQLTTTFTDFGLPANTDSIYKYAYMYHCHILDHEDGGMMHQFVVISDEVVAGMEGSISDLDWKLFPNPTTGRLSIEAQCQEASSLQLINLQGHVIQEWQFGPLDGIRELDLKMLSSGMYMMRWTRPDGAGTKRMILTRQ